MSPSVLYWVFFTCFYYITDKIRNELAEWLKWTFCKDPELSLTAFCSYRNVLPCAWTGIWMPGTLCLERTTLDYRGKELVCEHLSPQTSFPFVGLLLAVRRSTLFPPAARSCAQTSHGGSTTTSSNQYLTDSRRLWTRAITKVSADIFILLEEQLCFYVMTN